MESRFFQLDLPEEIKEIVADKAAGMRLSFPNIGSRHNPTYRKKRNKRICQKCNEGATIPELAKLFNLSVRTIKYILDDNGIQVRKQMIISLKEEITMLLKLGCSKSEISRRTGKSRQWIYELIKKEGLK